MTQKYPVFQKWTKILDWVLNTVEKYPKRVRFIFSGRIAQIALDILEKIVEAIYTRKRMHILIEINLYIEKLRVLFRISYERRYISMSQYEFISCELNEAGMMIGGWLRLEAKKKPAAGSN